MAYGNSSTENNLQNFINDTDLLELTLDDLEKIDDSSFRNKKFIDKTDPKIIKSYNNFEILKKHDKHEKYINKLSVLDVNTITEVIENEKLNDEEAITLIKTWVENDNSGVSMEPEMDVLLPEASNNKNSLEITPYAYTGEPKLIGNSYDTSGVHYIIKSEHGYNKSSGHLKLPIVTLKSNLSDPDVPYGHFGIYTSSDSVGLDLGTYYKQSEGKWRFFVSGYAERSAGNYVPYYKEIPNISYTPNQINKVYFVSEAIKGSSYDTYRLTVINSNNWSTIGMITVSTNEKGYNGEQAPNKSHINSNYSNVRMHREVTLAHKKQPNRLLTGSTIVGANWSDVYIYNPNTTILWGTNQTMTAERVGQTTAYANTVKYTLTKKWSEDIVDILYR